MACDFWFPLLDNEAEAIRKVALWPLIQRDGAWQVHVVSAIGSEAENIDRLQLMIAEELAGHALTHVSKQ